MNETTLFPPAVYTIWTVGLVITLAVFVPLAVYLLHRTWLAARSIQGYAADALVAAAGIAGNTQHIPALDSTITVASDMLGAAVQVVGKLDTVATVVEDRAS